VKSKNKRNNKHQQRGAAMVEMAIVLPVLVILVFAIIEVGIALNRVQAFHAAAREGARVGSLETTDLGEIQTAVNGALVGLSGAAPAIAVPTGTCAGRPGGRITVEVSSAYTISIPLLPDRNVTLTGDGVFRCEG
jgi:Flp pilus assembly protein TadG